MKEDAAKDGVDFDYYLGAHEAMYAVMMITKMVESELVEHPAIKDKPDLAARAERIAEELIALHERIAVATYLTPAAESPSDTVRAIVNAPAA